LGGNAGAREACCVITAINPQLPLAVNGPLCNSSKINPLAARPACASGSCCGDIRREVKDEEGRTGVLFSEYEFCQVSATTVMAFPKEANELSTSIVVEGFEWTFTCIESATKIVKSIAAVGAASYMMA